MTVEMFVCLGYGRFSYTGGDFRVGETPALTLGEGFSYTSYGPGDNVAGDRRSEIWFNSTEVGERRAEAASIWLRLPLKPVISLLMP